MSLTLHYHPLASFCWKVLIALYENGTPFEPHLVDLGDEAASTAFRRMWPIGKMPVLRDDARDRTIPETSIIIEYLAQHYPGERQLLPADPEQALHVRFVEAHAHDDAGVRRWARRASEKMRNRGVSHGRHARTRPATPARSAKMRAC